MDKNGKMIKQINIGPFSNCNRRLVKAGDYICFMSPFDPEINPDFPNAQTELFSTITKRTS